MPGSVRQPTRLKAMTTTGLKALVERILFLG